MHLYLCLYAYAYICIYSYAYVSALTGQYIKSRQESERAAGHSRPHYSSLEVYSLGLPVFMVASSTIILADDLLGLSLVSSRDCGDSTKHLCITCRQKHVARLGLQGESNP